MLIVFVRKRHGFCAEITHRTLNEYKTSLFHDETVVDIISVNAVNREIPIHTDHFEILKALSSGVSGFNDGLNFLFKEVYLAGQKSIINAAK